MTDRGATLTGDDFTEISGPTLFKSADRLDAAESQCLIDNNFHNPNKNNAACIVNPDDCADGLSFSIFHYFTYDEEPEEFFNASKTFNKEYIVSSGGESGTPGFAIFRKGGDIGAVVSTGNLTWTIEVLANVPPKNKWTNVAVRWRKPIVENQDEYNQKRLEGVSDADMGGLQLFIDLEPIGHVIQPEVFGCDYDEASASYDCAQTMPSINPHFEPPEMMLGCHRTKNDETPRNFGTGGYDELAVWDRRLNDTETIYFLGGYKEVFDNIDPAALLKLLSYVQVGEIESDKVFINVFVSYVDTGASGVTPYENKYPTEPTMTDDLTDDTVDVTDTGNDDYYDSLPIPLDAEELKEVLKVAHKIADPSALGNIILGSEFGIRLGVAAPFGEILSKKGKYRHQWDLLHAEKNHPNSHDNLLHLVDYLMYILERSIASLQPFEVGTVHNIVSSKNFAAGVFKVGPQAFREMGDEEGYIQFPDWKKDPAWKAVNKRWNDDRDTNDLPVDSVDVPNLLFTGDCESKDVSFVGTISDVYPDNGNKNPVFFNSKNVTLISRVIHIAVTANNIGIEELSELTDDFEPFKDRCEIDPKMLVRAPLRITLAVSARVMHSNPNIRKPLGIFEPEDAVKIKARHCAIWNPDMGLHGAWDTQGVKTVAESDVVATCYSTKMGTFAIIAELEETPHANDDASWLFLFKMVGYALSIISLMIFIGVIVNSTYLWEMFHTLGLNLAAAMLLGHIFMLVTEIESVRDDRDLNFLMGSFMSFFYSAVACLMTMESYAIFQAMISGVVGGRTKAYLCYGWGFPFIILGINIFMHLDLMGTDPRCMIGWDNMPKWTFFIPMASLNGVSVVLMAIVVCNICTPAMRKQSIVEELGSIARGFLFLVFLYALTWNFAPLAYIHFPGEELPDFYPAFQVMNSLTGLFVLVLHGFASTRFRAVITGKTKDRQDKLLIAAAYEPQVDDANSVSEFTPETETDEISQQGGSPPSSRPATAKSTTSSSGGSRPATAKSQGSRPATAKSNPPPVDEEAPEDTTTDPNAIPDEEDMA